MVFKLVAASVLAASAAANLASEEELEHFRLLNDLRANGFRCPGGAYYPPNPTPLKFDCRLWRASDLHSEDMAKNNYFSHTSQNGASPWDRAGAQGVSGSAENIAAGRGDPQDVLTQWVNSDGHCRNMGNAANRIFAVGRHYEAGSKYRYYWTQMFGRASQLAGLDESCLPGAPTAKPTAAATSWPTAKPTPVPVQAPTPQPVQTTGACKQIKQLAACEARADCKAKKKNGALKKCQQEKCKKLKDEVTCVTAAHCAPAYKNGKFKKCGNASKQN